MGKKAVDVLGPYQELMGKVDLTVAPNVFDDKIVIYSNDLARQASKFTLEEEKILHLIFSQIDPHGKNATQVVLKKKDLLGKLNVSSKSNYTAIHDRMSGMIKKSLIKIKRDRTNMMGVVIIGVQWQDYADEVIVELNPMFMPFIEELASFYTKLKLDAIITFKSKFTLALYKYLASWSSGHYHRVISMTTKELKDLYGLSEDDYINKNGKFDRYNFEKYAIDGAVKELNAKVPEFRMAWRKVKNGKFVSGYVFEWVDWDRTAT